MACCKLSKLILNDPSSLKDLLGHGAHERILIASEHGVESKHPWEAVKKFGEKEKTFILSRVFSGNLECVKVLEVCDRGSKIFVGEMSTTDLEILYQVSLYIKSHRSGLLKDQMKEADDVFVIKDGVGSIEKREELSSQFSIAEEFNVLWVDNKGVWYGEF